MGEERWMTGSRPSGSEHREEGAPKREAREARETHEAREAREARETRETRALPPEEAFPMEPGSRRVMEVTGR